MVRKRRRKAITLQERVDYLMPGPVREALREERSGKTISQERQAYLQAMLMVAIQEKQKATLPDVEAWVEIQLLGGKLRATRAYRDGDEVVREYIGDVENGRRE